MRKVSVERYVVGPVQTNCYFVINEETKEMVCIDPGDSGKTLARKAKENGWTPKAILLTHGHFDHVTGAEAMAAAYDPPIRSYILDAEVETLKDPEMNAGWMVGVNDAYEADDLLTDGEELTLAGLTIKVLATPGHTVGGCGYYFPEEGIVFSGDSLFQMSVGRTDFKGGSMKTLLKSIKEKLLTLPDEVKVYPGHGEMTAIGFEKINNPYIR